MKRVLAGYIRFSGATEGVVLGFANALLAFVMLAMFLALLGRELFTVGFGVLEEIARASLGFIAFLGLGVMLKRNKHIRTTLLEGRLKSHRLKLILTLIVHMITLGGSYMILRGAISIMGVQYTTRMVSYSEVFIPIWIFYTSLVIGAALLVMWCIELLIKDVVSLKSGRVDGGADERV